ncbi:MAG: hypothetical protein AAFV72_00295 [Cyanobacteria bacterium J06635_1]
MSHAINWYWPPREAGASLSVADSLSIAMDSSAITAVFKGPTQDVLVKTKRDTVIAVIPTEKAATTLKTTEIKSKQT